MTLSVGVPGAAVIDPPVGLGVGVAGRLVITGVRVGGIVTFPLVGMAVPIANSGCGVEVGMRVPGPCVGMGVLVGAEPAAATLTCPEIRLVDRPVPSRLAS